MRKNAFFMIIYQILILILPFVTMPYVSRVLGPDGVGIYSYTNSIVNYFMLVSLLGIQLYGRREIAKQNNKNERSRVFLEIYIIQILMSIISSTIYFLFIYFSNTEYSLIFIFQYINLLSALFDISWLYFGIEKFKICVMRNFLVKIISLSLVFIGVKSYEDLNRYILILAIANFVGQISMWLGIRQHIKFIKIDKSNIWSRFIPILKLFLPVIAIQVFSVVDKTMLGYFSDVYQVGLYENAEKIARIPITIITSIGVVMLPRMTNLIAIGEESKAQKYIEKSLGITMFLSIGATFGIFGISNTFIPLFLGEKFLEAKMIVMILSPIIMFISWGNVFRTQYILPRSLDDIYTKSVVYAAMINILFNVVFISKLGAIGASIASVIAEFMICFYQSVVIRHKFNMLRYLAGNIKYVLSGFVMLRFIIFLQQNLNTTFLSLAIQILGGGFIYLLTSLILELILNQKCIINELLTLYKKIFLKKFSYIFYK